MCIGGSSRFVVELAEMNPVIDSSGKQEVHQYLGPGGENRFDKVIEMC